MSDLSATHSCPSSGYLANLRPYFRPWPHAVLTAAITGSLVWSAVIFFNWAVRDAVFGQASPAICHAAGGACWAFLYERYQIILFGSYPSDQYWRPSLAVFLVLAVLIISGFRRFWRPSLVLVWIAVVVISLLLMRGGLFGLLPVSTSRWGGLPLTVGLSAFGIVLALPLSVGIVLGRRSKAAIIRRSCSIYVETVRGLPLIAVLFIGSTMLPFLLPGGNLIDNILRAQVALILFQAAYLAEAIRSGLDAVPRGQSEAGASLGLSPGLVMRLIVLPQAFRIALPAIINTFIESIKDTTLISIIGLIDVLGGARGAIADATWLGFYREAYLVVGVAFFLFCFILSVHSRRLEQEFSEERR
ncbi:amino acid ABC transporter permease [Rhizobium sp. CNPSo 3490]|uniref:amino acid ABC transporter permease n=1 Tax=Rhizobium sp. CNPSo 3490 TaxID=3021407 RepID=UPI00254B0CBB|nr:amino acid ABC transporter permease [Rhizobium sp. CNPSo 3490]MDK4734878.1 amino acid ABC transporter permease [Rhizobium sp. CNPSo 3490]